MELARCQCSQGIPCLKYQPQQGSPVQTMAWEKQSRKQIATSWGFFYFHTGKERQAGSATFISEVEVWFPGGLSLTQFRVMVKVFWKNMSLASVQNILRIPRSLKNQQHKHLISSLCFGLNCFERQLLWGAESDPGGLQQQPGGVCNISAPGWVQGEGHFLVVLFPNPGQILFHSISNTTQGKGNRKCVKSQWNPHVLCITPLCVTLLQFFLGKTDNGFCVRKKFVER